MSARALLTLTTSTRAQTFLGVVPTTHSTHLLNVRLVFYFNLYSSYFNVFVIVSFKVFVSVIAVLAKQLLQLRTCLVKDIIHLLTRISSHPFLQYFTLRASVVSLDCVSLPCCFCSSLSGASVPDLDGLVEGGRCDQPGVRGEEHLVDQGTVAGQAGQGLFLLRRVPQEHGKVIRPGHQPLGVGTLWYQEHARREGRHG